MVISEEQAGEMLQQVPRVGLGQACGTFGELLQGRLWEEKLDFLVTLPISCYSHATFVTSPDCVGISVFPPYKHKAKTLARMVLSHYALPEHGKLTIQSKIPVGKGLASSSADLVATARAISSCFHISIPSKLLASLMCQVEPSDGVMYPGVVSFYHRRGRLREFLGFLPTLTIIGIDEGGELDTLEFNQRPKPFTITEEMEYLQLLNRLTLAIRQRNVTTVGQVATRSAILNQKLNPKQTLNEILAICKEIKGCGVVVAHSGTCIGILLSQSAPQYHHQLQAAYRNLSTLTKTILVYHSVNFA